jgi:hypothetical protein
MTRPEVRKMLIRAVRGNLSEWREAVVVAALNGWSEDEIQSIITWYHPSTWILGGMAAASFVYTIVCVLL